MTTPVLRNLALLFAAVMSCLCVATSAAAASTTKPTEEQIVVPRGIPGFYPTRVAVGTLSGGGSSTVGTLLNRAAESFRQLNPDFRLDLVQGGGSTGPDALMSGMKLAPMSRPFTAAEIAAFHAKFGYDPIVIPVAVDAIAIFVNIDNPITGLTIEQVERIFARGGPNRPHRFEHWGELGLSGEWKDRPIALYGPGTTRGETALLRSMALENREVSTAAKMQLTQSSAVQAVAADPDGIGYASMLFRNRAVRALPIARTSTAKPHECNADGCATGKYPFAHRLYVYVNKPPKDPPNPNSVEFLRFLLSREGQQIMVNSGAFPLTAEEVNEILLKLPPAEPLNP